MAVAFALCRALTKKQENSIGNFWQDLYRSTIYILLPLSCILAVLLISEGVIQNLIPTQKLWDLKEFHNHSSRPSGKSNCH